MLKELEARILSLLVSGPIEGYNKLYNQLTGGFPNLNRTQLTRALKSLIDKGYIEKEIGLKWKRSIYRITIKGRKALIKHRLVGHIRSFINNIIEYGDILEKEQPEIGKITIAKIEYGDEKRSKYILVIPFDERETPLDKIFTFSRFISEISEEQKNKAKNLADLMKRAIQGFIDLQDGKFFSAYLKQDSNMLFIIGMPNIREKLEDVANKYWSGDLAGLIYSIFVSLTYQVINDENMMIMARKILQKRRFSI